MTNASHTVLVTGANRGIGLEFVRQYLSDGWRVLAACRVPERARALQRAGAGSASRLQMVALDVTDAPSVAIAAHELESQPIDLLLNCAGVMGATEQRLGHIDYADWAQVLQVNTLGPLRMLEAFSAHLARGAGRLAVTLTSAMGSIGEATDGNWIAYRTSKAAVNMAVKCAALELAAQRIVCIVMHPGWVRTDMGGAKALLSPSESVAAMRRVIAAVQPGDSGQFFNYDGRPLPW